VAMARIFQTLVIRANHYPWPRFCCPVESGPPAYSCLRQPRQQLRHRPGLPLAGPAGGRIPRALSPAAMARSSLARCGRGLRRGRARAEGGGDKEKGRRSRPTPPPLASARQIGPHCQRILVNTPRSAPSALQGHPRLGPNRRGLTTSPHSLRARRRAQFPAAVRPVV
jgi:hypothetical protein